MTYIALGCLVLALLLWANGGKSILKRREWRFISGGFAVAAFAGAAYVGLRGSWGSAIVLAVLGLGLAVSTRRTGAPAPSRGGAMGEAEARSILGVGPEASAEEVQAAYNRLMRLAHPDKGGTDGLAAQLNAARDKLTRR
ncbi:DnaJ domain-containing protein [Phenylobacterium sp.]|uniref:J domain-containing protein n=1 Tax=Phenylobacterium sp. TaxID=1871053 RepID=UPI00271BB5B3|nr:DnaJ domain-containing protein [Phenylobacterium sp.]MDO8380479.1 molecular chaperone DnaJ [Phenylobacterium sp.]